MLNRFIEEKIRSKCVSKRSINECNMNTLKLFVLNVKG